MSNESLFDMASWEPIFKGVASNRRKKALIRYLSKSNYCNTVIYDAFQKGGMTAVPIIEGQYDLAFMLWGKTPELLNPDAEIELNQSYFFCIEPSILKVLIQYSKYYEKQYKKNNKPQI